MEENQILMDSNNRAIIRSSQKAREIENSLNFTEEKAEDSLNLTEEEIENLDKRLNEFLKKKKDLKLPRDQYNNISACKDLKEFEQKINKKLKKSRKEVYKYNRDQSGCTDFVCNMFEKHLVYIPNGKYFMRWNGVRWKPDTPNFVFRLVELSMNALRDSILKQESPSKADIAYAHACCDLKTINAVFELLKVRVALNIPEDERFDTHPELLNVLNGTVNLRTGKLHEHRCKDYITQIIPINYNPHASRKNFKAFLASIFQGDQSLIDYVQTLLGYGITGETKEQNMHILYGNGSNGKSTLLEAVEYVVGEYMKNTPVATFIKSVTFAGAATPELVDLKKARIVSCNEWPENERLNESRIKTLVGSGSISVRALYGTQFSYKPIFKIFLDTNHYPRVSGADYGIWRRLRVVPFYAQFKEKDIDPDIKQKLFKEAEGILSWLVEGAVRYYRDGLDEPKVIRKATKDFKREEDIIGSFIEDSIEKSPGNSIQSSRLYEMYLTYCKMYSQVPQTETVFGCRMRQEGYERKRKGSGNFYVNIEVINEDLL